MTLKKIAMEYANFEVGDDIELKMLLIQNCAAYNYPCSDIIQSQSEDKF